ncbi:hypothetical protein IX95_24410 [Vibrio sp. B183]|uniref:hypothetical protein n=1 Tax=Vibrio sp. B183 TaxID=1526762 RepID=UPI000505B8C8|nr:hypothetical protein [Vibrio sp. B183]KFI09396.1 hypothetical protein IX95_24410 [Vibrio sp. B183]
MPLVVLVPLMAGGLGFGAGFWTGSSATKLLKLGVVAGGVSSWLPWVALTVVGGLLVWKSA